MKAILKVIFISFLAGISVKGYTQRISNPSFEGLPQSGVAPFPWTPCNTFSTPDTQPGFWHVKKPASDGDTYIGLVTRGTLGPFANSGEALQTRLNTKLEAYSICTIHIDLAFSNTHAINEDWGGFVSYANPVILKIWGGSNSCEKTELLWQSLVIDHSDWKTYEVILSPVSNEVHYLILEADYTDPPHFGTYYGNILIDHIVEKDIPEIPLADCTLETFNVFTPNGDGANDIFLFKAASEIRKFNLKICDRWGYVVFETNDLTQGWSGKNRGKDCATGVYFWYTEYMCTNGNQIRNNIMNGTVTLLK